MKKDVSIQQSGPLSQSIESGFELFLKKDHIEKGIAYIKAALAGNPSIFDAVEAITVNSSEGEKISEIQKLIPHVAITSLEEAERRKLLNTIYMPKISKFLGEGQIERAIVIIKAALVIHPISFDGLKLRAKCKSIQESENLTALLPQVEFIFFYPYYYASMETESVITEMLVPKNDKIASASASNLSVRQLSESPLPSDSLVLSEKRVSLLLSGGRMPRFDNEGENRLRKLFGRRYPEDWVSYARNLGNNEPLQDDISYLLEHKSDINHCDYRDDYAMTLAVTNRNTDLLKILLSHGARADIQRRNGDTPLILAVITNQIEAVRCIAQSKKNFMDKPNNDDMTALMIAADHHRLDILKILLEKNASVNQTDKKNWTALMFAVFNRRDNLEILECLVSKKANINASNEDGRTVLMLAIYRQKEFSVQWLIDKGVNFIGKDKYGITTLMYAAKYGAVPVVKEILKNKLLLSFRLNQTDRNGMTALMHAIISRKFEIVDMLLETKATLTSVQATMIKKDLMIFCDEYYHHYRAEHPLNVHFSMAEKEARINTIFFELKKMVKEVDDSAGKERIEIIIDHKKPTRP